MKAARQNLQKSPPFGRQKPFTIRLTNSSIVIGGWFLTYSDLFWAMTKMHRTIEVIRVVSTGTQALTSRT